MCRACSVSQSSVAGHRPAWACNPGSSLAAGILLWVQARVNQSVMLGLWNRYPFCESTTGVGITAELLSTEFLESSSFIKTQKAKD